MKDEVRKYRDIKDDYAWTPDIMKADDEKVDKIKWIINAKLSSVDRILFLLYTDCQSYRKLGKRLGVSHMCIRKEILRIKKMILEEYENLH